MASEHGLGFSVLGELGNPASDDFNESGEENHEDPDGEDPDEPEDEDPDERPGERPDGPPGEPWQSELAVAPRLSDHFP